MPNPARKLAFIIAATEQGTLIVNRFDQVTTQPNEGYGVGRQLLESQGVDGMIVTAELQQYETRGWRDVA